MLESITVETIVSYGFFAVMFVWLLHDTKRKNESREGRYHEMMSRYQERNEKREMVYQEVITKQTEALMSMSIDLREIKYLLQK